MLRIALTALPCLLALPASADDRFDGQWGIEVRTLEGSCDPTARFYVAIEGGQVRPRNMMGEAGAPVGRVGSNGRISGRFGSAEDPLRVRGRLEQSAGSGSWSASGRGCSGSWTAFRR